MSQACKSVENANKTRNDSDTIYTDNVLRKQIGEISDNLLEVEHTHTHTHVFTHNTYYIYKHSCILLSQYADRMDGGIHTAVFCVVTPYSLVNRYKYSYENMVPAYESTRRHIPKFISMSTPNLTRGNIRIKRFQHSGLHNNIYTNLLKPSGFCTYHKV